MAVKREQRKVFALKQVFENIPVKQQSTNGLNLSAETSLNTDCKSEDLPKWIGKWMDL